MMSSRGSEDALTTRRRRKKMSKYVRRIIPFGSGDIPAVQRWLEDMAEKGLFFKECGLLFAKFTKGEPKKM